MVIETHDGVENRVLSEEKIQKIMKDTTNTNGGFLDLAETDGGEFCVCCVAAAAASFIFDFLTHILTHFHFSFHT